jgi:hypothetical protein
MKRKLYKALVPQRVRDKIYQANVEQFKQAELAHRIAVEAAIPHIELSAVYITNLRICTNQHALLNTLPKHAIVAEIGAAKGEFSDQILTITQPKKLHVLDSGANRCWTEEIISIVKNKFKVEIATDKLVLHPGNSLLELEQFDDGYFDWVYINVEHSYEQIGRILEVCQTKVKPDGIISGRNYMIGAWLEYQRYGVIEAVHEFCKKYRWEMIYLTHESHRNLSYAITRMAPSA